MGAICRAEQQRDPVAPGGSRCEPRGLDASGAERRTVVVARRTVGRVTRRCRAVNGGCQPRGALARSSSSSGACRRVSAAAAVRGTRSPPRSETDDRRRGTRAAPSTPRAGRAAHRPRRGTGRTRAPRRPRRSRCCRRPHRAATAPRDGEPRPPDPEHEQRAERRGGDGEGQRDRLREVDPAGDQREQARHDDRDDGADAEPAYAVAEVVLAVSRSCDSTPATETDSPLAVDRNAANAPAATSAESDSPSQPSNTRPGSTSTTVSAAGGAGELGRVDAAERPEDRREQVEDAEQPEHRERRAPGGAGRRGSCRSARARAAGPSCRGRSRARSSTSSRAGTRGRRSPDSGVPQSPAANTGAPSRYQAATRSTAGSAMAASLSQYWNACTTVIERMPPVADRDADDDSDDHARRPTAVRRSAPAA